MEPYTAEGMARQEAEGRLDEGALDGAVADSLSSLSPTINGDGSSDSGISSASSINGGSGGASGDAVLESVALEQSPKSINYELVGIVVHSGQANAGHYYSFIKDRRFASLFLFVLLLPCPLREIWYIIYGCLLTANKIVFLFCFFGCCIF